MTNFQNVSHASLGSCAHLQEKILRVKQKGKTQASVEVSQIISQMKMLHVHSIASSLVQNKPANSSTFTLSLEAFQCFSPEYKISTQQHSRNYSKRDKSELPPQTKIQRSLRILPDREQEMGEKQKKHYEVWLSDNRRISNQRDYLDWIYIFPQCKVERQILHSSFEIWLHLEEKRERETADV